MYKLMLAYVFCSVWLGDGEGGVVNVASYIIMMGIVVFTECLKRM